MTFEEAAGCDASAEVRKHFEPLARIMAGGEPVTLGRWETMLDQIAMSVHAAGLCSFKAGSMITVDQSDGLEITVFWYRDEGAN